MQTSKFVRRLCIAALFMAINIILSSFGVPVPGGHLYLNDIAICAAAILLEPRWAVVACGLGAFLGDFFFYPAPMIVTLLVRSLQACVISNCMRRVFRKRPVLGSVVGVILGAVVMVVGYSLGRAYIYSTPEYAILKLPYQIAQAALGVILGPLLVWKLGLGKLYRRFMEK